MVRAFLEELNAHGITPGSYHLADWEESPEALYKCLESLFRITPPTALIIDEAPFYVAALQFCSSRGLRVPEDVSLVCADPSPTFEWSQPTVAHIRWETGPVVVKELLTARRPPHRLMIVDCWEQSRANRPRAPRSCDEGPPTSNRRPPGFRRKPNNSGKSVFRRPAARWFGESVREGERSGATRLIRERKMPTVVPATFTTDYSDFN